MQWAYLRALFIAISKFTANSFKRWNWIEPDNRHEWWVRGERERKNVTVMVQCVNGYKCAWGTERERGRTHKNTLNYSVFVYQTEITMRISFRIYSLRVFKALAVVRTKRSNIYQQHQDVRQTKFVCFASCRRFCLSSSNSQNSWMKPLENKLVAFVHKFY